MNNTVEMETISTQNPSQTKKGHMRAKSSSESKKTEGNRLNKRLVKGKGKGHPINGSTTKAGKNMMSSIKIGKEFQKIGDLTGQTTIDKQWKYNSGVPIKNNKLKERIKLKYALHVVTTFIENGLEVSKSNLLVSDFPYLENLSKMNPKELEEHLEGLKKEDSKIQDLIPS